MDTVPSSESFVAAWRAAQPRPPVGANRDSKKNFAERLSRGLTEQVCADLRARLGSEVMTAAEVNRASNERNTTGLNVIYGNPVRGLSLGVSIKTVTFPDAKSGRYTKNYKRIDQELSSEALDHHERQPFAVLVALLFMPVDATTDGVDSSPSSFGYAVQRFRPRIGRRSVRGNPARFEHLYVGLFDVTNSTPRVGFFDALEPPPKRGLPELLAWSATLDAMVDAVASRGPASGFRWLDEETGVEP